MSIRVRVVWGVDGVDREDVDLFDSSDLGRVNWDEKFDLSGKEAQMKLREICHELAVNNNINIKYNV